MAFLKNGFLSITLAALAMVFCAGKAMAVSEANLRKVMSSEVMPYIEKNGHYESLAGSKGMALSTFTLLGAGTKGDVIISSGQGEFIPKYYEIAYDLILRGYSAVHIIDHRGQR